jgi:nucleotide-binding universal stress UspA family protein
MPSLKIGSSDRQDDQKCEKCALGEEDPSSKISADLGVEVENVRFKGDTAASGIVEYLSKTPCDLVVLSTHGRDGVDHWLKGSVSEAVFRSSAIPTLFITRGARGFVSQVSGDIQLRRVLVPIDFSPTPSQAIERIQHFGRLLGTKAIVHLIHVGNSAPPVHAVSGESALPSVILRFGNVVKSIVDAAIEYDVDFIGMPNIILQRSVFPELIQSEATPAAIDYFTRRGSYSIARAREVLGYEPGTFHTSYGNMERYIDALTRAASDRVVREPFGRTYEFRERAVLIITSPENLRRLDAIGGMTCSRIASRRS